MSAENFKIGEKFLFLNPGYEHQVPSSFEFFASKEELAMEAKEISAECLPHWHAIIAQELATIGKLPWRNYDIYIRIR